MNFLWSTAGKIRGRKAQQELDSEGSVGASEGSCNLQGYASGPGSGTAPRRNVINITRFGIHPANMAEPHSGRREGGRSNAKGPSSSLFVKRRRGGCSWSRRHQALPSVQHRQLVEYQPISRRGQDREDRAAAVLPILAYRAIMLIHPYLCARGCKRASRRLSVRGTHIGRSPRRCKWVHNHPGFTT